MKNPLAGRLAALPFAIAVTLLLAHPALAAAPASGTLTDAMSTLNYTIPAFTNSNPSPVAQVDSGPRCSSPQFPCDSYKLTVTISAAYVAAHPNAKVKVSLGWDTAASDYDMHIYTGDVTTLDGSMAAPYGSASSSNPEIAYLPVTSTSAVYTIKTVPYTTTPADKIAVKIELQPNPPDPCLGQFGITSNGAVLAPGIAKALEVLTDGASLDGFIHFRDTTTDVEQMSLLANAGLTMKEDFRKYANSVYVVGTVAGFRSLIHNDKIGYIESNDQLRYLDDVGVWSSRIRVTQEPVSGGPYYDAANNRLTGKGTTVCVVDSGVFGAHPDFAGRIKHNYKVGGEDAANTGVIDVGATNSDTTGGHGTHCTGIAAGSGSASTGTYAATASPLVPGTYAGTATEAGIVVYGVGEALVVLAPDTAFKHILDNYNPADPDRIRVISNSYGQTGGTPYSPAATSSCLTRALIKKNISVVYAASNDGGDGSVDKTSPTCKDPTPGVICVASYNDSGTGTINGPLSSFSSRGKQGDPTTYPDIAAPGDLITSPCVEPAPGQAVCASGAETNWAPYYGTISGTSMATPQVAGIIALLYQARPNLTPAQVEVLLQNTARKIGGNYEADPQNPGGTINVGYGAGLVDLPAALEKLGVPHGLPPTAGAEYTILDGDTDASAPGASDVIKLTMQEVAGTPNGVQYRLTLKSATVTAGGYIYSLEGNYNGNHFVTQVGLSATGPTKLAASGSNTAPATSVALTGNVLSFFVPYYALGSPPVKAPVHNIRVVVTDSTSGEALDYAPSPANVPAGIAATQPSYGRPFTVQMVAAGAPVAVEESTCTPPGLTLFTDPSGDQLTTSDADLLQAWIGQPFQSDGSLKVTFKVKINATSASSLTPNQQWFVSFQTADKAYHGVRMSTSATGAQSFESYTPAPSGGTPPVTDGRFEVAGSAKALDAKSNFAAGIITLVANAADIGVTKAGDVLSGFNSGVTISAQGAITAVSDSMPNGLGRVGSYTTVANAFCAPNTAPIAKLSANPINGPAPLDVSFDGTASSDPDAGDKVASYTFDYGDGTTPVTQAMPTATHRYTAAGTYTAKLTVTDSRSKVSDTAATAVITVTPAASNTAPTARLTATPDNGVVPLDVTLDGSTSSDPDSGDSVAGYTFDFGDGSATVTQTTASVTHRYATVGNYTAKLTVTDTKGAGSAAATRAIMVTAASTNTAPTARLAATPTSGTAPLDVSFDGSASSDPDSGDSVSSYTFDFGDGSKVIMQAGATTSHRYTAAGTYTATLLVTDTHGASSTKSPVTITVTATQANNPPTTMLKATPDSGTAPLAVTLDATGSSDPDSGDAIASYTFNFGDGSAAVTQAGPTVQHTYTAVGRYTASVTATDTHGAVSGAAPAAITVAAANTAPVAKLTASPANGTAPLDVTLDASGSSDADSGDKVASYTFTFGDGSAAVTQTTATVKHTYIDGGMYAPSVVVSDTHGATSNTATASVTVSSAPSNHAPTAVLKSDRTSGTAPMTVNFDGSASSDPDSGDKVASYTFDFGDGSSTATQATPTAQHAYLRTGTFTARLTVADTKNATSNTSSTTITVVDLPAQPSEPSRLGGGGSASLFGLAGLGLAALRRRRRQSVH